jgi:molybdopterin converting factor small subunit
LAIRYPKLAGLIERSAFAVDAEFAQEKTPIPATAVIALLPPVSGG